MTVETAGATAEDVKAALSGAKAKKEKAPKVAKEKVAKASKPEKVAAEGSTVSPSATIQFGKDAEGKTYGPDNVPYRPDSKRAQRFALITPGMTAEAANTAGLSSRRLLDMVDAGFITIVNVDGSVQEAPVQAADEGGEDLSEEAA